MIRMMIMMRLLIVYCTLFLYGTLSKPNPHSTSNIAIDLDGVPLLSCAEDQELLIQPTRCPLRCNGDAVKKCDELLSCQCINKTLWIDENDKCVTEAECFRASSRSKSTIRVVDDQIFTRPQMMDKGAGRRSRRSYMTGVEFWPNAVIPYVIDSESFNNEERYMRNIQKAMSIIHDSTCIRFVPRDTSNPEPYFVRISALCPEKDCSRICEAQMGRSLLIYQPNTVTIGLHGCAHKTGIILHELMHTLGFVHEHQRPDRDDYVYINYSNVDTNSRVAGSLRKLDGQIYPEMSHLPYDYRSVMHYENTVASKNNQPTIIGKSPHYEAAGSPLMGAFVLEPYLSEIDKHRLNIVYCGAAVTPSTKITFEFGEMETVHPRCQEWANEGKCDIYPTYMKQCCAAACGTMAIAARNKYSQCNNWARGRKCIKYYSSWMSANCVAACVCGRDHLF